MKFVNSLGKAIGWLLSHAVEGIITFLCSCAALASLFIFDNVLLKVIGFVGSFIIAYLIGLVIGKLRGEDKL